MRGSIFVLLVALLFSAAPAPARTTDAEKNAQNLQFDPETSKRIGQIERLRQTVKPPPVEAVPQVTEAEKVREGSAAIEDVLRETGAATLPPRDVNRELFEIVEAETKELGEEAKVLYPDDADLEEPPEPDLPLPPWPRRVEQHARTGIDDRTFFSAGASKVTSNTAFAEYRLRFDDHPAPKSRLRAENALFASNERRSGYGTFDFEERFDRHRAALIGGSAILERWTDLFSLQDSVLASGFGSYVIHLPDQLDLSGRYTYTRRTMDHESIDTLSTENHRGQLRLEKRMSGGTARFEYLSHQLDVPSDRSFERSDQVVLVGYTAPVLKKVDVDYAYIRRKETPTLGIPIRGQFVQTNNQINLLWRFSHFMSLSIDVDTEFRSYTQPDVVFPDYERTLLGGLFTVVQNAQLSYNFGYATEFWYYRPPLGPEQNFDSTLNNYHVERYTAGATYTKKRFTVLGTITYAPTRYDPPGNLQSPFFTVSSAATTFYQLDDCTRVDVAYSRVNTEFDSLNSNYRGESILAQIDKKF